MASAPIHFRRLRGFFARSGVALLVLHSAAGPLVAVMPLYVEQAVASHNTDLSITKVADDTTINIGDTVTYTITVSNASGTGTDHVDDVTVTDVLPAGLTYVSHADDDAFTTCTYTGGSTTLSCAVATDSDGKMHKGETVVITLIATTAGCGGISNTATVSEADPGISESNTANNSDTEVVTASNCGTITIVKDAVPNDAQNFGFTGDLGTFTLDDDADGTLPNSTVFTRVAGTYEVTEDAVALWELTGIECGADVGSSTNVSTRTATIDLDSGENITCTFTNEQDTTATITIVKQTVPDGAGQEFDFEGEGFGEGSALENEFVLGDGDSETDTEVDPGEGYSVTETVPGGWTLTGIECEGEGASVDLANETVDFDVAAGDDVTCTFTNTKHASLTINKYALGGDGTFTIGWSGNSSSSSSDIITSAGFGSMTVPDLFPTTYSVTEELPGGEGEWDEYSNTCDGMTLAPGSENTCDIVNRKRTRIVIGKETTNGSEATFDFTGTFGSSSTAFQRSVSGPGVPAGLDSFFDIFAEVSFNASSVPSAQPIQTEIVELSLTGWNPAGLQCTRDSDPFAVTPTDGEDGTHAEFTANAGEVLQCLFLNTASECGNSDVENAEQCDDGNTAGGDGCSATCQGEIGWACDDSEPSICTTSCGDGTTAGAEQCDDGGNVDGDGCDALCNIETCGDGIVNNIDESDEEPDETCDDGNDTGADGCSATCQTETGYNCPTPNESCTAICGDGLVLGAEQCDDGESDAGDGCSASCTVETGYQCDNDPLPSQCELHLDFGDAPDAEGEGAAYPTLLEHNGARHVIVTDIHLGESIDGEPDGQPNSDATGDDGESESDDEDGVTFNDALVPGTAATVTVDASTGEDETDYFLDAWFDWNQDEDWNDEGEHVITADPLTDGENAFEVSVPSDAVLGDTFARFRMSDEEGEGVGVTGLEDTGEVEDYKVTVTAQSSSAPSEGSSSSASSDAASSIPDEGEGSSAAVITGLGIPDGPGAENGQTRGNQTHMGKAFNRFLAAFHLGNVPPGGFGGGSASLSPEEKAYLCSVQRALPENALDSFLEAIAADAALYLGRPAGFVKQRLLDRNLCSSISASLLKKTENVVIMPKPFYLAADGMPHSWTNETWDKCIRGTATLSDIRANPLRPDGVGVDCAAFHTDDTWYHPDLHMYFTFSAPSRFSAMKLVLPHDYIAVKDGKLVMK